MMSSIVCCSVANFAPEMIEYYFLPEQAKTTMLACFYAHSECLGALLDSIDILLIQTLRSISNYTILNFCMRVKSNIQIRPNDVFRKVILEHAGYVCGEVL